MPALSGRSFWTLFLTNACLLTAVVSSCAWLVAAEFDRIYREELSQHLTSQAEVLARPLAAKFEDRDLAELGALTQELGGSGENKPRITLILADGSVIADSAADAPSLASHADRPEVCQALRDGRGSATRWSETASSEMHYVATRVGGADAPTGVVRLSMTTRSIGVRLARTRALVATIAAVVLAAALLLSGLLARSWSGRLAHLTTAAENLSAGDLSTPVRVSGAGELADLGRSLNRMRDHLSEQMSRNFRQRRTLEFLLAQLHEGVLVADPEGHLVLINPAAARMLDIPVSVTTDSRAIEGLTVEACVADHDLQRMLIAPSHDPSRAGDSREAAIHESRLSVQSAAGARTLLARASDLVLPSVDAAPRRSSKRTPVTDPGYANGRLLVLTDVTELTRTLQVKADFVANASHELRTPLSAIRAAVETALSLDFSREPQQAMKLLTIVDRHSARLEALVSDLLDLSRLESPGAEFRPAAVPLVSFVAELHERFREKLQAKRLCWELDPDDERDAVLVSPQLLELVMDNLVDNAIKFTETGGHIRVSFRIAPNQFVLVVQDDGCGIPEEAQSRVFERFYQVERSRTGVARGTGLGLSIVRHAVTAMGGSVALASAPGAGTRMTVTVPQPQYWDA